MIGNRTHAAPAAQETRRHERGCPRVTRIGLHHLWHSWQGCSLILALLLAMSALAAARPLREETITVGASIGVALSGRCPASFEVFNLRGSR